MRGRSCKVYPVCYQSGEASLCCSNKHQIISHSCSTFVILHMLSLWDPWSPSCHYLEHCQFLCQREKSFHGWVYLLCQVSQMIVLPNVLPLQTSITNLASSIPISMWSTVQPLSQCLFSFIVIVTSFSLQIFKY